MRGTQLWMVVIVVVCLMGAGIAFRVGQSQTDPAAVSATAATPGPLAAVEGLVREWQAQVERELQRARDLRKSRAAAKRFVAAMPRGSKVKQPPVSSASDAAEQRLEEFAAWTDGLPNGAVEVRTGEPVFDGADFAQVPVAMRVDLPGTTQPQRRMPIDAQVTVQRQRGAWTISDVDSPRVGLRALDDITYIRGSNYTVIAPGAHRDDAERLHQLATDNLPVLGERYEDVAGSLRGMAVIVDDDAQVEHVTDNDSVRAETHATAWMYDNGDIVVFWPAYGDLRPEVRDGTFVHELTHAVTLPLLGKVPIMLAEGIAMREEIAVPGAEGQDFDLQALDEAFSEGTVGYLGLIRNTAEAIATTDEDQSIISYLAGYATIRVIEDQFSETQLQRLLVTFRSGVSPDDAIRRVLDITPNTLRRRVQTWVADEVASE